MGERIIRIMLLVGSNGRASACIEGDAGWGDLADNVGTWKDGEYTDPDQSDRHIVTVSVPEPSIGDLSGRASRPQEDAP